MEENSSNYELVLDNLIEKNEQPLSSDRKTDTLHVSREILEETLQIINEKHEDDKQQVCRNMNLIEQDPISENVEEIGRMSSGEQIHEAIADTNIVNFANSQGIVYMNKEVGSSSFTQNPLEENTLGAAILEESDKNIHDKRFVEVAVEDTHETTEANKRIEGFVSTDELTYKVRGVSFGEEQKEGEEFNKKDELKGGEETIKEIGSVTSLPNTMDEYLDHVHQNGKSEKEHENTKAEVLETTILAEINSSTRELVEEKDLPNQQEESFEEKAEIWTPREEALVGSNIVKASDSRENEDAKVSNIALISLIFIFCLKLFSFKQISDVIPENIDKELTRDNDKDMNDRTSDVSDIDDLVGQHIQAVNNNQEIVLDFKCKEQIEEASHTKESTVSDSNNEEACQKLESISELVHQSKTLEGTREVMSQNSKNDANLSADKIDACEITENKELDKMEQPQVSQGNVDILANMEASIIQKDQMISKYDGRICSMQDQEDSLPSGYGIQDTNLDKGQDEKDTNEVSHEEENLEGDCHVAESVNTRDHIPRAVSVDESHPTPTAEDKNFQDEKDTIEVSQEEENLGGDCHVAESVNTRDHIPRAVSVDESHPTPTAEDKTFQDEKDTIEVSHEEENLGGDCHVAESVNTRDHIPRAVSVNESHPTPTAEDKNFQDEKDTNEVSHEEDNLGGDCHVAESVNTRDHIPRAVSVDESHPTPTAEDKTFQVEKDTIEVSHEEVNLGGDCHVAESVNTRDHIPRAVSVDESHPTPTAEDKTFLDEKDTIEVSHEEENLGGDFHVAESVNAGDHIPRAVSVDESHPTPTAEDKTFLDEKDTIEVSHEEENLGGDCHVAESVNTRDDIPTAVSVDESHPTPTAEDETFQDEKDTIEVSHEEENLGGDCHVAESVNTRDDIPTAISVDESHPTPTAEDKTFQDEKDTIEVSHEEENPGGDCYVAESLNARDHIPRAVSVDESHPTPTAEDKTFQDEKDTIEVSHVEENPGGDCYVAESVNARDHIPRAVSVDESHPTPTAEDKTFQDQEITDTENKKENVIWTEDESEDSNFDAFYAQLPRQEDSGVEEENHDKLEVTEKTKDQCQERAILNEMGLHNVESDTQIFNTQNEEVNDQDEAGDNHMQMNQNECHAAEVSSEVIVHNVVLEDKTDEAEARMNLDEENKKCNQDNELIQGKEASEDNMQVNVSDGAPINQSLNDTLEIDKCKENIEISSIEITEKIIKHEIYASTEEDAAAAEKERSVKSKLPQEESEAVLTTEKAVARISIEDPSSIPDNEDEKVKKKHY
ncbi:hypothetical protein BHE74_00004536 [Ensete ventricosum]|nr:hypothetical protein BHE74_00004536 [Ensete ventricosum]